MSFKLFQNKESKKVRNVKRDDVRKVDSNKLEKLLLLKEKEVLVKQKESSKGKGFR